MGGTHLFHDTKAAEATHKNCVKIAGERSRVYSDVNLSAANLLQFNMRDDWFQKIFDVTLTQTTSTPDFQPSQMECEHLIHIRLTAVIAPNTTALELLTNKRRCRTDPRRSWDLILCEGVPVSVRELVSLFADIVGFPMADAHLLLQCSWTLGWHIKSESSKGVTRNYWGGGVTPNTTSNYLRGDWLETTGTDQVNGVATSRLVRVICGVSVEDLGKCPRLVLRDEQFETDENKQLGKVHFFLVRYAQRHPLTRGRRGPDNRPLCPGVLQDTHCLWEWATRQPHFRRGCLQGAPWDVNRQFFGNTEESQLARKDNEIRAWYDLIQVRHIKSYANVQLDPDRNNSFLQSVMWW